MLKQLRASNSLRLIDIVVVFVLSYYFVPFVPMQCMCVCVACSAGRFIRIIEENKSVLNRANGIGRRKQLNTTRSLMSARGPHFYEAN